MLGFAAISAWVNTGFLHLVLYVYSIGICSHPTKTRIIMRINLFFIALIPGAHGASFSESAQLLFASGEFTGCHFYFNPRGFRTSVLIWRLVSISNNGIVKSIIQNFPVLIAIEKVCLFYYVAWFILINCYCQTIETGLRLSIKIVSYFSVSICLSSMDNQNNTLAPSKYFKLYSTSTPKSKDSTMLSPIWIYSPNTVGSPA